MIKEYIAHRKRLEDEARDATANAMLREIERADKERKKAEEALFDFQKKNPGFECFDVRNSASQHISNLKRRLAEVTAEIETLNIEKASQNDVTTHKESLAHKQEALQKSIEEWEKSEQEANKKAAEYGELKSHAAATYEQFDLLIKKFQEIPGIGCLERAPFGISKPATAAVRIGPNRFQMVLMSALTGLLVSAVIIFSLEYWNRLTRSAKGVS